MLELSAEQVAFHEEVAAFARDIVAPQAARADADGRLADGLVEQLAARGYLGVTAPEEYGGLGRDDVCYALAVEELSRACGSTGILVAAHNSLGVFPIVRFGTDEQKRRYLPSLVRGGKIGAFGLTEACAGSDAAGVRTVARPVDGGFVLNGSKTFITSGSFADVVVVAASLDPSRGVKAISNFLVDHDAPGFSTGRKEDKLGLRGSDTSELFFQDCHVPEDNLLGKLGDGFKQFMITLDGGRISIGAMAVGLGQAALDTAWAHLEAQAGTRPEALERQATQMALAEMETRVAAARLMVLHAARLKSAGQPHVIEAAMAKGFASEAGTWAASQAIQICGEGAMEAAHPASRIWRDVRLCQIGEGTTEVQRIVIFRHRLKRRAQALVTAGR